MLSNYFAWKSRLGDKSLKCGLPALVDALTGSMGEIHCRLHLDRIELIDLQIEELNKLAAAQMQNYQDAITRLIEIPGIGAEGAGDRCRDRTAGRCVPLGAAWPPGLASAPAPTRAPGRTIPAGRPKEIASYGGCCVNPPRPPLEPGQPSAIPFQAPSGPLGIRQGSLGSRSPNLQDRLECPAKGGTLHRVQRNQKS